MFSAERGERKEIMLLIWALAIQYKRQQKNVLVFWHLSFFSTTVFLPSPPPKMWGLLAHIGLLPPLLLQCPSPWQCTMDWPKTWHGKQKNPTIFNVYKLSSQREKKSLSLTLNPLWHLYLMADPLNFFRLIFLACGTCGSSAGSQAANPEEENSTAWKSCTLTLLVQQSRRSEA